MGRTIADLLAALSVAMSPEVATACRSIGPEIEAAAELAGVTVSVALAWAAVESRCSAVEGRAESVAGVTQVSWAHWGALLSAEGWREDELLHPGWSMLAGARVLQQIDLRWPGRSVDQRLCIFGVGTDALGYRNDCTYSRAVMRLAKELDR